MTSAQFGKVHVGAFQRISTLEPRQRGAAMLVYAALCVFADKRTGVCWPKQEQLAELTGMSKRNVGRALKVLEDIGLVVRQPMFNESGRGSTRYQLPFRMLDDNTDQWVADGDVLNPQDGGVLNQVDGDVLIEQSNKNKALEQSNTPYSPPEDESTDEEPFQLTDNRQQSKPKGEIIYPEGFDRDDVRDSITEWLDYKRDRRQAYKSPARQITKLLKQFAEHGPEAFISAVDAAIGNNWAGVHPPKEIQKHDRRNSPARIWE